MGSLLALMKDRVECMRVGPLLQSFLDGQLSPDDAVRVSRHLDACRRCGMAAETFREIKAGLSRLDQQPDPESVERLQRFVDDLDQDDR